MSASRQSIRPAQPTAYLIVSDVPERALTLRLIDQEGRDSTVPISPIRALALAADLVTAAARRLG